MEEFEITDTVEVVADVVTTKTGTTNGTCCRAGVWEGTCWMLMLRTSSWNADKACSFLLRGLTVGGNDDFIINHRVPGGGGGSSQSLKGSSRTLNT